MPKVSVILTSLNHEKYIKEAIDSVLNQTFTDFELIIWDDASRDNSWRIINEYQDPRIRAFRNEETRRGIWGVNKAIMEITQGKYIAIHHSDDIWHTDKLAEQVSLLDSTLSLGAVFTWVKLVNESSNEIEGHWFDLETDDRWQLLRQLFIGENHLNHPSVLIRKSVYETSGVYKYGMAQIADAEMWSRMLLDYDIHIIKKKLTSHRYFSDGSNTSGVTLEKNIRMENEWNIIRINYFNKLTCNNIYKVFPELKKYYCPTDCNTKFLLSMACLELCNSRAAWALGLNSLYEIVTSPSRAQVKTLYNFDYPDLILIAGQYDPFCIEAISGLQTLVNSLKKELTERDHTIESYRNSRTWKYTEPLRMLRRFILNLPVRIKNILNVILRIISNSRVCYRAKLLHIPQSDRKRIVHLIGNFMTGGSSRLVVDLYEHLGHRYEQQVVTQRDYNPINYSGIPVYKLSIKNKPDFHEYLKQFRPDLIHVHYWGSSDFFWYRDMIESAAKYGCKMLENVNTPVKPYLHSGIAKYVYVSDYVADKYGGNNCQNMTIYPGSNFSLFKRDNLKHLPDDCIGMVYRLINDKLNERSIDVFIKVVQKRPQTKVIIVGGGSLLASYRSAVKASKLNHAFQFTGYVPYERLPELYAHMSIFVAPVKQESFGQVSSFAMSMGMPVVGYNVGALGEILGDTSLLAEPGNSDELSEIIISLLDDKQRGEQIGKSNRERAHKLFSVENMINSYSGLYQSLID